MGRRYQGLSFSILIAADREKPVLPLMQVVRLKKEVCIGGGRDIFLLMVLADIIHFQILVCNPSCKVNTCTRTWSQDLK